MRDKRPVDELSIEELERILAIKKREARMERAQRYRERGRTLNNNTPSTVPEHEEVLLQPTEPQPTPQASTAVIPSESEQQLMYPVDADEVAFVEDGSPKRRRAGEDLSKALASWALLVVEVAAVLGLIYVLYVGFTSLDTIQENTNRTQEELASAQEASRVTSTPLPELSPYQLVIPGGHFYNEGGAHTFNTEELNLGFELNNIPQNLRPALQNQAQTRTISYNVEPQPGEPAYIDIPQLDINQGTVWRGADWETLQAGMGWYQNGATLSNGQNIVIVGHNDIYGEIFKNLADLNQGDEFIVYDNNGRSYTYRVTYEEVVEPTEVRVLDPNSGSDLTLITCHPYRVNTQRYIVYADRIN